MESVLSFHLYVDSGMKFRLSGKCPYTLGHVTYPLEFHTLHTKTIPHFSCFSQKACEAAVKADSGVEWLTLEHQGLLHGSKL